ncbi:hypothetical protein P8C59_005550 [Phyllachora maydis]|uniref:F-box domain-containing protein n=1 Tax=Phyllachora maydis TaxID=1825666 RepID=A0AAD9MBJ9_9PEZI|nr:hypothetical protein P8C59_005550 [Phyllachora maydis]
MQLAEDASVRPESAPLIASELGERLRRLSPGGDVHDQRDTTAGNRISEYENALMAKPTKSSQLGFKTLRHSGTPSRGTQLLDFPNEILTHVLSHLHPDSHGAVALVSRRFYALVTTPYAWRAAFLRHFLGHTSLAKKKTTTTTTTTTREKTRRDASEDQVEDRVRSEHRYFARLTPLASWRSEYLFRTRLLRGLVKGRPGNSAGSVGASGCPRRGKKTSAVLTYNSKLPWLITHADAAFVHGKKRPRVMHGAADLGVATMSDPATGRVEQWGLDDPFSFVQLDELLPDLEPFGLGDGPAAISNVMDVSQAYGMVGGEGFPGGRAYFRATDENRGRYLGRENAVVALAPEIPKIPELVEAVTSVWIAKSPSILTMTQSMVGIMTGSSLGVVTTYALGHDASGLRYSDGDVTARWILSPGVPIISLTLDDKYSPKRKFLKRVWAVALNALGEVYYLVAPPMAPVSRPKADDAIRHAWLVGRTVHWELVESTRRTARPKKALVAEAQEIENFLGQEPSHFRRR